MSTIWVCEDHKKIRLATVYQLERAGYATKEFDSAEAVWDLLTREGEPGPDLLLLDVRLGGMSGVDLVTRLAETGRLPNTVILSGEASISETVVALQHGVYDFVEKPASSERLLQSVRNALTHWKLSADLARLRARLPDEKAMLGRSRAIEALADDIRKVGATESRVLINGESGSGKELVAAAIHRASRRVAKPLVKINCAAIPAHLIEAELFGHVRGAFTDARSDKPGLFEQAHGGTLFLDEIGDMDLAVQARLLRVLEDARVRRVGDTRDRPVDVRVIAATHRDLEIEVREGRFREDLFFRLSAIPLRVPPLRERLEDIPLLFQHFVEEICVANRLGVRRIDAAVFDALRRYVWPGNVRELRNIAERMVVFGGDPLTPDGIPASILEGRSGERAATGLLHTANLTPFRPMREFRRQCEKEYLELVLHHVNWNVTAAARLLDLRRPHLHEKIRRLGLRRPD